MKSWYVYKCSLCKVVLRVPGDDPDLSLLPLKAPCPSGCSNGELQLSLEAGLAMSEPISAKTLYAAINGFGLPDERRCSPDRLKAVLVGAKVVAAALGPAGHNVDRSIVEMLSLDSGVDLHFSSSTRGATIYKITVRGEKTDGQ